MDDIIEENLDSERYFKESVISEERMNQVLQEALDEKIIEKQKLDNGLEEIRIYYDTKYSLCPKENASHVRIEIYDNKEMVEQRVEEINPVTEKKY